MGECFETNKDDTRTWDFLKKNVRVRICFSFHSSEQIAMYSGCGRYPRQGDICGKHVRPGPPDAWNQVRGHDEPGLLFTN